MATAPMTTLFSIAQRKLILDYAKRCAEGANLNTFRTLLTYRDKAYQRQLNTTAEHVKALQANMRGDARKMQDLTVPIVMPQIESAVAYQAGVYLSSYPIFGVVASAANMESANQYSTALSAQARRYGWARELVQIFRNGFKYNFGAAFVHWKKTPYQKVVTSTDDKNAGKASLTQAYQGGNCIETIDPYNCFMDMDIPPARYHEDGEYFGWNLIMNRMKFKRFLNSLASSNTTQFRDAMESSYQDDGGSNSINGRGYHHPQVNAYLNNMSNVGGATNWLAYAGLQPEHNGARINYKDKYLVTPFVFRGMPSDMGIVGQGANTPKIYLAYIVNWKFVVYVEEIISVNDHLPIFIVQPYEDGLGYQTQSMLDNALPFQDMSSALWNATLESKRRQIFDRLIYNQKFIDKKDIDVNSAVARIPLRNAALFKGEDIGKAVYQIPYRDDNSGANLQMSEMISQMADVATGQNKVSRGQFQKGNKTQGEFETTMDNSNARSQLVSMNIEGQFMVPMQDTIKSNTLYYQVAETLLDQNSKKEVEIDPVMLRKAILEYKTTDGLLPVDKLMNPQLMMVFMQTAQAMPVVMTEYDTIGMMIYWMKLKGATWLDEFKRNDQQKQEFLSMYEQTSKAQNATNPEQPVPAV